MFGDEEVAENLSGDVKNGGEKRQNSRMTGHNDCKNAGISQDARRNDQGCRRRGCQGSEQDAAVGASGCVQEAIQ